MNDLAAKEKQILSGLKDFQRATVERVFALFMGGQSRVLVADEVGLGKTLIAKGVIAKTAVYHQQILKDELFKVVYVCSNQSIANQNLLKLMVHKTDRMESLSDTRLPMQHLKIFEDEIAARSRDNYIQLIPLTPSTSFNMTGGVGIVNERALIFAVLRRYEGLKQYYNELEIILTESAKQGWETWARDAYEKRVVSCDTASGGKYLKTVLNRIDEYFNTHEGLLSELISCCKEIGYAGGLKNFSYPIIHRLRRMMAEISIELMDPDLVIMDEFQRFPELIKTENDSETAMLAQRFFNSSKRNNDKIKILLLSATPYKLYSTLEEINDNQADEHYREFLQLTDFLFDNNPGKKLEFRKIWNDYSVSLNEIGITDLTILTAKKNQAEDTLFNGICRTERFSIEGADKFVDIATAKGSLEVSEEDILSYVLADKMLVDIGLNEHIPVDYIKSAPFILSFMERYKLKTKVFDYFKKNPDQIALARKPELWVNEELISNYEKLPVTNARLKRLYEEALPKGAERFLWVPPSRPYYELGGVYAKAGDFSKILVFSSWEMVPRAIASLVSYEAERLTVGELAKKHSDSDNENRGYFPYKKKVRFPAPRLKFNMNDGGPAAMALMCLLYPSVTLARLYSPIESINAGMTKKQIEADLRSRIESLLDKIPFSSKPNDFRTDESWYYIAPLLFDLNEGVTREWLNSSVNLYEFDKDDKEDDDDDRSGLGKHLGEMRNIIGDLENLRLGRRPRDLVDVLVKMAMASPAVCALRLFGVEEKSSLPLATRLAKTIIDRFNSQEATSIVELGYNTRDPHWKKVLHYCTDGNVQAMLDEYAHILVEDNGLLHVSNDTRSQILCERMNTAIKIRTSNYSVDTYRKFRDRINKGNEYRYGSEKGEPRFIKMRSGYAAGYYDVKNADKSVHRKETLRLAFNSPFRPFVLATTSIGQEGLDFHCYCRKIMHWNLPSNPIDLEQREGRINRYKCLAIRQNIAKKYDRPPFQEDIWHEMFDRANQEEKQDLRPELVPFWCLPDETPVKIERIVPMYPLSKDQAKYERLIKVLSIYRLSLGQARQEELLEYVLQSDLDVEQLREFYINLSPYFKKGVGSGN